MLSERNGVSATDGEHARANSVSKRRILSVLQCRGQANSMREQQYDDDKLLASKQGGGGGIVFSCRPNSDRVCMLDARAVLEDEIPNPKPKQSNRPSLVTVNEAEG